MSSIVEVTCNEIRIPGSISRAGAEPELPVFNYISIKTIPEFRFVSLSFAQFREFSFSERVKRQFRAEAFNFTNTLHLGMPDGWIGDGEDFMAIAGVSDLAREGIDECQFRFGLWLNF